MEELLLDALFALDELDIVDEEHIGVPVAALEGNSAVITQGVDEVVGEFFGGDVLDPHTGKEALGVVAGRMQQVSFTETRFTPNEQRVVRPGRRLGDSQCSGVGESVGGADDERVEGVPAI